MHLGKMGRENRRHGLAIIAAATMMLACGNPKVSDKAVEEFYQPVSQAEDVRRNIPDVLMELPRMEVPASETMIEHEGFRISYNRTRLIPNWVAYELTKSETYGNVERTDYFDVDPSISGRQAQFSDYSHTGYDRGHMAPAGDMKWSQDAMDACFYLTNICPQNHNLNKGAWNDLEIKCRQWARRYGKAWIVTGPVVTSEEPKTIGRRHVVVPDAFFKVVLVPKGEGYEAAAFVMKNDNGNLDYTQCSMTVDEAENLTGIDFYYALPDDIEDKVERSYNASVWK
ncbi:MAG: DNA/RNA non-specific endonuclease [Bacteroidaceae bacterium]|nr:DNA/RNA non-specific endonuclease [Bacteroidaceae bacterium]